MVRIVLLFLFAPVIAIGQGIQGGYYHSTILCSDSSVYTAGYNNIGQLGNGTNTSATTFVATGLTGVIQLATGNDFTIALKSNGTVWTWGSNKYGQLGTGTTADANVPLQVNGLNNVMGVFAGEHTAYAVLTNGDVYAWGRNNAGQVGNGTLTNSPNPIKVHNLNGVKSIAAGQSFAVALTYSGNVFTWGNNKYGQLGLGDYQDRKIPTQVSALSQIDNVSAGRYFAIALKSGSVYVWGDNSFGNLGLGDNVKRNVPALLSSLTNIDQVVSGQTHVIAMTTSGDCYVWGQNYYGQLGNNLTSDVLSPLQITFSNPLVSIGAGKNHSFAFDVLGIAYAWGFNSHGQLGLTAGGNVLVPTVSPLPCTPAMFNNACNAIAQIGTNNSAGYCIGDTVELQSASVNAASFKWLLNGVEIGSGSTLNHVFSGPGANSVQLVINENACESSTSTVVNILPDPTAAFNLVQSQDSIYLTNTSTDFTSVEWNFGDITFSNETNPTHVYANAGTYTLNLTAYNSCGQDTALQQVTFAITGFPVKQTGVGLSIYPNPASNTFMIKGVGEKAKISLKIIDAGGKTVFNKDNVLQDSDINVSGLVNGVYTVKISNAESTIAKELVIKR